MKEFIALSDANYSKIFYHTLKQTKNSHDAADITQNTFFKALKYYSKVRNPASYEPWLFAICNNEIKQFYRNTKKTVLLHEAETSDLPLQELPSGEDHEILYAAIDDLSEIQRQVVLLKYFGGYTMQELGVLLSASPTTVKSRLYEARKTLKKLLDSHELTPSLQKERRNVLMSTLNLCTIGVETIPCMSLYAQKQLLQNAKDNSKYSPAVLAELANIPSGQAFTEASNGKISYEELLRILSCCDDSVVYRLGGSVFKTHRSATGNPLVKDLAALCKTGGYFDSVEPIIYVKSIPETVAWYRKHLNWSTDCTDEESEQWGHAMIFPNPEFEQTLYRHFKGFHLRAGASPNDPEAIKGPLPNCSFFVFVSGLEGVRDDILEKGWEKISEIRSYGWGVKAFDLTDMNGLVFEFCEWENE